MRTIYWYLHFVITLLFTIPSLSRYKKLKKSLPEKEFYKKVNQFTSSWAMSQVKASGARVHITGLSNLPPEEEAVLFISNHQSNFDIALLMSYVTTPKGFVAKAELLKVPLLRTWMGSIKCIFMDRHDMRSAATAITQGIQSLKDGFSLVIFPEGTRSKSNNMGEFKAGSFKLATKSGAAIVPVTVRDTFKIMEANNSKIKPADVYITIHPPVPTKDLTKEEQNQLPDRIKEIIAAGLSGQKQND